MQVTRVLRNQIKKNATICRQQINWKSLQLFLHMDTFCGKDFPFFLLIYSILLPDWLYFSTKRIFTYLIGLFEAIEILWPILFIPNSKFSAKHWKKKTNQKKKWFEVFGCETYVGKEVFNLYDCVMICIHYQLRINLNIMFWIDR